MKNISFVWVRDQCQNGSIFFCSSFDLDPKPRSIITLSQHLIEEVKAIVRAVIADNLMNSVETNFVYDKSKVVVDDQWLDDGRV